MGETCQVNMQSQVTNLETTNAGCYQDMEGMRLACLRQKVYFLQIHKQVSTTLTVRMWAARELKDGRSVKEMYSFLTKLNITGNSATPSNPHPFQIIKTCKLARSQAAVSRCHRLPPIARAVPWCPPRQRPNYLP
ncbi:hypothetical protein DPEC_G00107210 [Dallia pectoralis]|uniref:Uncharacterized protein n=1 Tax=Dallia pectoralis TaxID=75939 RepID=A0ACC2GS63_DALPE|nr:hypothetical protein DPEC_G00107210 [Dallia pectoralis]